MRKALVFKAEMTMGRWEVNCKADNRGIGLKSLCIVVRVLAPVSAALGS